MEPDDEDLYSGKDELTGLHDSFYFSTEVQHRIAELKHSGRSNALLVLSLPEDTPEETVKEIAEHWKKHFLRAGRYEKKDYSLIGIDEDTESVDAKKDEILEGLKEKYPDITLRLNSVMLDGDSPSLDSLVEQAF